MAERITGHTELVGLMAYPIRHSSSPAMHNEAFAYLGLDYAYLAFEVDNSTLEDAVKGIRALKLVGSNVSMPNKTVVHKYLDEVSPAAQMCGAVNTIVNDNGRLIGHITDGIGYMQSLKDYDIDVIGNGDLPDHYEVELPLVMVSALERLREFGLPKATVHANNRKLSEGFYRGLGLTDVEGVLREIDKLDKIGADEVAKLLVEGCGADENQARACLELAELTAADGAELSGKFDTLCEKHGIANDSEAYVLARQGLDTLAMIVDEAARIRPGSVIADLKIARGLDYYTGSVYETFLDGAAALGSICSGGRYDNLASQGNRKYPGVGLSIGLSRLVSYMLHTAGAHANRVSPASVLVAVWNEEDRSASNQIANQLRARGIAADVAPTAAKLGKQIKYADKLGIPYVWFPADKSAQDASDEVKNIITGDQQPANAQSWEPDTVYAQQTVTVEA